MRTLIIGCGYIGIPVGAELARQGHEVFGLRRQPGAARAELEAAGIQAVVGDVTDPSSLAPLPGPFDWIVNTVASSGGNEEDYRRTYLEGTRALLTCFRSAPPRKFVYTSSTGVYGQMDGSLVKETHPTEPATAAGRVLVETEQLLLRAARDDRFPAIILRVAGIYGPARGHYLQQFLKDEAKIPGNGERLVNMVHRDDVVGAVLAALRNGRAGEVYNVVDDEPVAIGHLFRWLAESLGRDLPPHVPEDAAAQRRRGLTHKKVQNRRLKMELGYSFRYPTFRQGYTAEIQRLDRAGEL